jgi:hypothetical protein
MTAMDCREFRDIVADLARRQARRVAVDEPALAHAAECGACAMLLAEEEKLAANLDALRIQDQGLQAPPHLESALVRELRALNGPKPLPQARRIPWAWWTAAAAAAVLAVWLGFWRQQPSPATGSITMHVPEGTEGGGGPTAPAAPPLAATTGSPVGPVTPERRKPGRQPLQAPTRVRPRPEVARAESAAQPAAHETSAALAETAAVAPKQEVVTDFVPLTYGGWTSAATGARLVRVRLPATALLYFGLPPAAGTTSVDADVVLGEDGLAHAVRFVRPVMASTDLTDRGSRARRRY